MSTLNLLKISTVECERCCYLILSFSANAPDKICSTYITSVSEVYWKQRYLQSPHSWGKFRLYSGAQCRVSKACRDESHYSCIATAVCRGKIYYFGAGLHEWSYISSRLNLACIQTFQAHCTLQKLVWPH